MTRVSTLAAVPRPTAMPDSVEALLRELVVEVRGLRADLAPRRPVSALSREDRTRLARMLPALLGVFGSEELFSSRDLAEDARPALRLVVRGLSVKKISKLFARAEGIPINGLMVQKQGEEFQVAQWRIVAS